MRTTITFDADTAAVVEALRHERNVGVSAAVNELIRRGASHRESRPRFVQETSRGGALIDVTCIGEALDYAEGPTYR